MSNQVVPGFTVGHVTVLSLGPPEKSKDGKRIERIATCSCSLCGKEFARSARELWAAKMGCREASCKSCARRGPFFKSSLKFKLRKAE